MMGGLYDVAAGNTVPRRCHYSMLLTPCQHTHAIVGKPRSPLAKARRTRADRKYRTLLKRSSRARRLDPAKIRRPRRLSPGAHRRSSTEVKKTRYRLERFGSCAGDRGCSIQDLLTLFSVGVQHERDVLKVIVLSYDDHVTSPVGSVRCKRVENAKRDG